MRIALRLFKPTFLLGLVSAALMPALSEAARPPRFDQTAESKDVSQLIRANSVNYWMYMCRDAELARFADYARFSGVVAGDPHMGNFSVIPVALLSGERRLSYLDIDFDDAGRAPFALDFMKLVIANKAAESSISIKDLVQSYVLGLQGQALAMPATIARFVKTPMANFESLTDAYVEKHTDGDRFYFKDGKLESYQGNVRSAILDAIFQGMTVLDLGVRPKSRGGSAEALRIWALVRDGAGRKRIFELKERQEPAVAACVSQLALRQWSDEVFANFWPGIDRSNYQLVELGPGRWFWLREKKVALFDVPYGSSAQTDIRFMNELAIYNAYLLGLVHGHQPEALAYRKMIEANPDLFREALKPLVKSYLQAAEDALVN